MGYTQMGSKRRARVRKHLIERDGLSCRYCGLANVELEIEHVKPRSKGGTHAYSNLVFACGPCNDAKGDQLITPPGWRKPKEPGAPIVPGTPRWAYGRCETCGEPGQTNQWGVFFHGDYEKEYKCPASQ